MTKLVAVICTQDFNQANEQYQQVANDVDCIELRLDHIQQWQVASLSGWLSQIDIPVIVTLRQQSQGGLFDGSEVEYEQCLQQIARCQPEYIDIEYTASDSIIEHLSNNYPALKIIRSYHNLNTTPDDLEQRYQQLKHPAVTKIKIVTQAQSSLDTLRLLQTRRKLNDNSLTMHAMGDCGQFSRVLGVKFGNAFCYACIDELPDIGGIISVDHYHTEYHFSRINRQSKIYALLGDPVKQSPGAFFHNAAFDENGSNAIYIKIPLQPTELMAFFDLIQGLDFNGFSVTMPLKNAIKAQLESLSDDAQAIAAVNTVVKTATGWHGENTDAIGAFTALEQAIDPAEKSILIIGAGGSAMALAYILKKHNAKVTLINRTHSKAQALADRFDINAVTIDQLSTHYDVIISTLPPTDSATAFIQLLPEALYDSAKVVMDIVYKPKNTAHIQRMKNSEGQVVTGDKMFAEQAKWQQAIWQKN